MPKVQLWRQKIQNKGSWVSIPNEVLCKVNGYHIPSSVMLSFSGKMKGLLCWWKVAPLMRLCLKGGVYEKLLCLVSTVFLVAMGLSFCMSHLEGDPWGSDRSVFGRWLGAIILHGSHLCLEFVELYGLAAAYVTEWDACSGSVLMLHQIFRIPQIAHLSQHSWVELLCFPSKRWRKKNH